MKKQILLLLIQQNNIDKSVNANYPYDIFIVEINHISFASNNLNCKNSKVITI